MRIQIGTIRPFSSPSPYIPGPYGKLKELPIPEAMAEAEAETEFAMEAALMREEILLAKEMLAPPGIDEKYGN